MFSQRIVALPSWGFGLILILLGVFSRPPAIQAGPDIFASPIQAGCYLARNDRCKIHVEPFTINLAPGTKLVNFQLVANPIGGSSRVIYDFRPDLSNPVPFSGSTFSPTRVAKDFGATCGRVYTLSLQGQDTGDSTPFNLGATGQFSCPRGEYRDLLPTVIKQ